LRILGVLNIEYLPENACFQNIFNKNKIDHPLTYIKGLTNNLFDQRQYPPATDSATALIKVILSD